MYQQLWWAKGELRPPGNPHGRGCIGGVELLILVLIGGSLIWGCAPGDPVVAKIQEPWEEEYVRAMMRPEATLPTAAPTPAIEVHTHTKTDESDDPDVSRAAAQLVGLPFRGIGWLLRAIF